MSWYWFTGTPIPKVEIPSGCSRHRGHWHEEGETRIAGPGNQEGGEEGYVRARTPDKRRGELFGIADQLMGGSRLKVMCEDGVSRLARIPGKMKRRMWIREGDLVILRPWEFQDEKADIVWRYTRTQAQWLSRKGIVPESIDIY